MNINDWVRHAVALLKEAGCPDPEIDARWTARVLPEKARLRIFLPRSSDTFISIQERCTAVLH